MSRLNPQSAELVLRTAEMVENKGADPTKLHTQQERVSIPNALLFVHSCFHFR